MPKKVTPLSHTQLVNAKPREREYNLSDGNGLQCRIKPSGARFWIFTYQHPHTKKRSTLGLGSFPEVSLVAARNRGREARELVEQGIDPKEHRNELEHMEAERHEATLQVVTGKWLLVKSEQIKGGRKLSSKTVQDIKRSFELHIFPKLGATPLHKLTAQGTIAVLRPVYEKGSKETVKRLCQRINEVMRWATNVGLVTANPLAGITDAFAAPDVRHLPSIRPEQLPQLMQTLASASIKHTTRQLALWQLHTVVRPGEAAQARWSEIDEVNNTWLVPSKTMKMRERHRVPLTPSTLAVLAAMRPISGSREFIFPGDRNPQINANRQSVNTALKRHGFKGKLVASGFRKIFRTGAGEKGIFTFEALERALAHTEKNKVVRAYDRGDYLEQRREVMAWWSELLERAFNGTLTAADLAPPTPENVISGKFGGT
ncbi:integrase arm-type DNA-binding domain-containing protein [Microbulbifer sp. YPW1]|uniref:integrase arm-type DNA-binding domain-containing protein n=1 Tax=Microbulbifer sp. YPW1 TaxID=2745199 RepID=UPI00159956E4|nr:integrase arm-type DNA-binding domain-containing protein [Microbulbifer sp. YPW1]QKX17319.1 integrase arm-type DNA-binding domain-containing protein [Microbulbifer sp. YPW1]